MKRPTSLLRAAALTVLTAPLLALACASTDAGENGEAETFDGSTSPRPDAGGLPRDASPTSDASSSDAGDAARDALAETEAPVSCPICTYPGSPAIAGTLGTSLLSETSGLAASRVHANVLYAHNDSGDTPRLFMLGTDGSAKNTVDVTGATAVDWEDVAVAPCGAGSCVFVADIGDNAKARTDLRIYRIPEPSLTATTAAAAAFPVQYPDGPHDAETLLADGSGALYIVTKETFGAVQLFALGVPGAPGTPLLARSAGKITPPNLGFPPVTGGDFFGGPCPRMVLRTYGAVLLFEGVAGEGPEDLAKRTFRTLTAPLETQGEAIAFAADGRAIFTASEGSGVPLFRYGCGP
ncbi:MAG: hypothetical protein HOO96_01295 [Polyangiaceae bacterium]|nr:hypothetical protein [Polyangiaceae bacterium]